MAIVILGPHLVKNDLSGPVASDLEHTGYSIELSGDDFTLNASLYRLIHHWQPDIIHLADFFICVEKIPFSLTPAAEVQEKTSAVGTLVSLESMLCSLYVANEVNRPITSLLEELRNDLSINHCFYPRIENGSKLMKPVLVEAGFEVIKFFSCGRTLSVQFGWVFPQDRQDLNAKLNVYAGTIEFKPKPDRTLDKGRWQIPSESSVAYLFTMMLESLGAEGLLSEAGTQAALDSFNWTKVSLLTTQEAKRARVDFVRQHPELHNDHQAMAKALKSAELYSDAAEVYAIKKQVPRLIREAGGN
jgi:hypothetical protein